MSCQWVTRALGWSSNSGISLAVDRGTRDPQPRVNGWGHAVSSQAGRRRDAGEGGSQVPEGRLMLAA